MAAEHNLIERLKVLPVEKQRQVLSLMRRDLGSVVDELTRRDLANDLDERQRPEALVEKLLAEREMIRMKVEALIDAVAEVDSGMAAELDSAGSFSQKATRRSAEEPQTLFAHRGSIVVSGEQDFTAIRKDVIEEQVREENR
jgi:hypothetical protein